MANNSMSAIGTGISLQGGGSRVLENIVGRRMAIDAAERRAKNGEEKIVNLDEFGNNPDLYPAIATQIKKIKADAIKRYQEIKSQTGGDANKARNIWEAEVQVKKDDVAALVHTNNVLKDYELKKSQKTFLTPDRDDIMATANNPYATAEDWAKLDNPDMGITATPTFGFSANLTPRVDILGIIEKHNKNAVPDVSKTTQTIVPGVGGKQVAVYTTPFTPNDNEVQNATNAILGDDAALINYKRNIRPQLPVVDINPDFNSTDPTARSRAQRIEVENFVRKNMSAKPDIKYETYTPPRATEADKKRQWKVDGNAYKDGSNVWHYDRKENGDETFTFSKVNPSENFPLNFTDAHGNSYKGVATRFEKAKDKLPALVVTISEPSEITTSDGKVHLTKTNEEVRLPYNEYNASKIENEYGQNPYGVRRAITGTVRPSEGLTTGSLKERSVKSIKKSSAKELSGKVNPFELKEGELYSVGGKTYTWNGKKLIPSE